MPLRLSAMRTRKLAIERQNEYSFTTPSLKLFATSPVGGDVRDLVVAADLVPGFLVAGERLSEQRQFEAAPRAFCQHRLDVLDAVLEPERGDVRFLVFQPRRNAGHALLEHVGSA